MLSSKLRKSTPELQPPPVWLKTVLLGLSALFLLGLFSTEFADTDSWWHLKTGEYILTQHRLPYPDPFSYTTDRAKPAYPGEAATQHFNLTHEWLAQAAMYAVERMGGMPGEVLRKALLLTLCCGFAGLVAARRTGSLLWGVAAAFAAASVLAPFAHDRPSILSFLFTAAFIAIFEHRRRLWLLPALALVWANCHGGFFLGWVVCGAYAADALVRRSPDWRRIAAFSGAAVLVSGINPNGFGVLRTLSSYRQSPMTSTLIEWSKPGLWGEPRGYFLLLYGAALVLILAARRVRISDWLLFGAFAAASLTAYRNEPLIGILAPILIAAYFPWKRPVPRVAPYAAAGGAAAGLIWGIATGAFFQLRAAEWRFPAGAASFLRAHAISAPLFNTYEYGGYLIWRGMPVFIDGRALSESVFNDYRMILGTPPGDPRRDEMLRRWNVGAIAMNAFEYNSGIVYPLALALAQPGQSEWKLVYDDAQALVFLRDVPPGMQVLDKSRIFDHLDAECSLHVEHDPEFSLCARTLGEFYMRNGNAARARRAFALYLAHPYDDDPEPRREYMQLLQR